MSHYFSPDLPNGDEDLRIVERSFHQVKFSFITDSGVFSKKQIDFGSSLLIETIQVKSAKKILDLGCGYGSIGSVIASLSHPDVHVTMVDINPRAVKLAKINVQRNKVAHRTSIYLSDGYEGIPHSMFDLVLFNPPIRAGKSVVYRLFAETKNHLNPGGRLVVVMRKKQGAESAKKELMRLYPQVEVLKQKKGYWVMEATMFDIENSLC